MSKAGRIPPAMPPVRPDARLVWWVRFGLFVVLGVLFGLLYLALPGFRAEVGRVLGILGEGNIEGLRDYILSYGLLAPVISVFLMVVQALAAPLPSFVITFANGLAFGVFWGWLLSLFGHTLAAAVCFGVARYLGRGPVEVLVGKAGLQSADRWFANWGMYAVFVGRLIPGISFDVISFAAGLTRMRFKSFLVATVLGVLPQTFLYSFLGRQAPQFVGLFLVTSGLVVAGFAAYALHQHRKRRRRPKRNLR
ncbi:TVP38/TMEM64 family protein [Rubrobacter xylanophilus]|uniref:TVP38/TMEM64 family membrane protein n=1 Tax=Rubrobacter xylanophilus TaxID=49319 RepID=A0A510HLA5_9ACTN|nr:TVP38/TMEM64 family protein [Rubrobacter xylanophilus]BBL80115.1 TVP38/TMEM64 family protein [Rubrobacter xylanophilus]